MSEPVPLLTTTQMAQFVTDGYLRFDGAAPPELSAQMLEAMTSPSFPPPHGGDLARGSGLPLTDVLAGWPPECGGPVAELFALPLVRGIVESLVGPEPIYDEHAVHVTAQGVRAADEWHADHVTDPRRAFDVEFLFFPADTPREMGGTMLLPGSHFRRASGAEIGRYQNFLGQQPTVCEAGTLIAMHHRLWHCAQPNRTDRTRYMLKVCVNPKYRQLLLWDTSDLEDPEVSNILKRAHQWYGEEFMLEIVNRLELWHYVTGRRDDPTYWLTRRGNEPELAAPSRAG